MITFANLFDSVKVRQQTLH